MVFINEEFTLFLSIIGCIAIIVAIGVVLSLIVDFVNELIDEYKHQKRYKHRFDKPPTAKCYCKDCKKWNPERGSCAKFKGWLTADSWFCWDAEPITKEQAKREERNK